MGGRGSSSGAKVSPPKYLAESAKAVKLKIGIDYYDIEKNVEYDVWVPKSQLSKEGIPGSWISDQKLMDVKNERMGGAMFSYWKDANGKIYRGGMTEQEKKFQKQRERRFEAGKKSYNQLVDQAKSMGIKGVRVGMRRSTIERKIKEAK